jgi:hypothetical protein
MSPVRAPFLQQRVGGHSGAVQHLDHVAAAHQPGLVEHLAEAVHDRPRVVVDAGGHLLDVQPPVGVQGDDVGDVPPMSTATRKRGSGAETLTISSISAS